MEVIGLELAAVGTLRSGGAAGADSAFERGYLSGGGAPEIYLPYPNYNRHSSELHHQHPRACEIASIIHSVWNRLAPSVQKLHARNIHQVLGVDLRRPTDVVVCWTPDGAETVQECTTHTGGTATAISLAHLLNIPVVNLIKHEHIADLSDVISTINAVQNCSPWKL